MAKDSKLWDSLTRREQNALHNMGPLYLNRAEGKAYCSPFPYSGKGTKWLQLEQIVVFDEGESYQISKDFIAALARLDLRELLRIPNVGWVTVRGLCKKLGIETTAVDKHRSIVTILGRIPKGKLVEIVLNTTQGIVVLYEDKRYMGECVIADLAAMLQSIYIKD